MKESLFKASFAELIGTFILVFFGCGIILVNEANGDTLGLLGIALAFGLIVLTIIFILGEISGAHINPAVTIALAFSKQFPWVRVGAYVFAQILGATLGALLLRYTLADGESLGLTQPSGSLMQAFFLETIMSAFLMFVIMMMAHNKSAPSYLAGFVISATIVIDILVGGPITGASMNPARSLGPALAMMQLDNIWIYLTAPILGTICGGLVYSWSTGTKF